MLKVSIFYLKLSYIASYVLNSDIKLIIYLNCIYTSWRDIANKFANSFLDKLETVNAWYYRICFIL